jgi:outer membrane protein OmpA-like peptidoglycan-associated protein
MSYPFNSRISLLASLMLLLGCLKIQAQMNQGSFAYVNSAKDEQAPFISPDGKVMYWTVAHHPKNTGGEKDPGDIWMAVWTGSSWSQPQHGGSLINNAAYNAVCGISHDGDRLFLVGHYAANQQPANSQGISVSIRSADGWSAPQNINIPYFMDRGKETHGYLSTTLGVFVFSAESYITIGAEDIYMSRLMNGQWSEPINLGTSINTSRQEFSPSLSADGAFLYFASNGRKNYGATDIYYAQRLDDSWTNWSTPVNMGANVNSEGRELFYRTYPESGFSLFTSTHNSDGYGDIQYYKPPKDLPDSIQQAPAGGAKIVEIVREKAITEDEKQFRVFGQVTDSKTARPIRARLSFHADKLYDVEAAVDGRYSLLIPSVSEYSIRVEAEGYVGNFEKLDVRTYEMKALEMNYKLQPIEVGATVNLKSVLFQQSTPNLLPESNDELDLVVSFLKTNPRVEISLSGHTDGRGHPEHNLRLSQKRVERVKAYLVSKGINARRIAGKGFGGTRPIAGNDNEETRRLNRRVEFTIVKD